VRACRDYTSVRAKRDHIASAESLSIRADLDPPRRLMRSRDGLHACASHASEPKGW